jgi:hypothetical protein
MCSPRQWNLACLIPRSAHIVALTRFASWHLRAFALGLSPHSVAFTNFKIKTHRRALEMSNLRGRCNRPVGKDSAFLAHFGELAAR